MQNLRDIGVAVIGAGFIGPVHVEALKRVGVNVRGILGIDNIESDRAAGALGLPMAYLSLDKLLADPSVHAVHIATPNKTHFNIASRALAAGKHVMCEKPLAMDTHESSQLVALARDAKLAAGVNYNLRYYPLVQEARERVRSGSIGDVFSVVGSYVQDWLLYPTDYNWRVLADEGGNLRAIADIGTHWLDLVQEVTGLKVISVFATLKTVHKVRQRPQGEVQTFTGGGAPKQELEPVYIETEDCGAVMLGFSNGAIGTLWVSQVTAGRKNCLRFEISGSTKSLAFNSEEPNTLWIGQRGEPNQSLIRDPSLLSKPARPFASYPGGHAEGFPDTMKQCFGTFYRYIAAGDFNAPPTFPTFADGHREIALCEAIAESNLDHGWVELPL